MVISHIAGATKAPVPSFLRQIFPNFGSSVWYSIVYPSSQTDPFLEIAEIGVDTSAGCSGPGLVIVVVIVVVVVVVVLIVTVILVIVVVVVVGSVLLQAT